MLKIRLILILLAIGIVGCGSEDDPIIIEDDLMDITYSPKAYDLVIPEHFPKMSIPADNPLTVDGVALGRHLFYDPILSRDSTMSCATCHNQKAAFTDNKALSEGIDGILGRRSAMSLVDVGFHTNGFFWDGSSESLESQALLPVEDPIELHDTWHNVEDKLRRHLNYPVLFRKAFGISKREEITKELAAKAMAQFERSLVSSGTAKYDRVVQGLDVFTDQELQGHDIYFDINDDISRHAECGHCHNAPLFTINDFANNGIDDVDGQVLSDLGRGAVTKVTFDNGKFKIPTIRNLASTAPYMHDGRLSTLDEVLDHYITGGHPSRNLDPVLRPLNMSADDRAALKAFIATLQDDAFLNDPRYASPFK